MAIGFGASVVLHSVVFNQKFWAEIPLSNSDIFSNLMLSCLIYTSLFLVKKVIKWEDKE